MKSICKVLILVLLTLSLLFALLSCNEQKQEEDDSWAKVDVTEPGARDYARKQKFTDDSADTSYQNEEKRVDLPTIPW